MTKCARVQRTQMMLKAQKINWKSKANERKELWTSGKQYYLFELNQWDVSSIWSWPTRTHDGLNCHNRLMMWSICHIKCTNRNFIFKMCQRRPWVFMCYSFVQKDKEFLKYYSHSRNEGQLLCSKVHPWPYSWNDTQKGGKPS